MIRRRAQKIVRDEYLQFEDPRVWELICYNYGDVEDMRGKEIASGQLEGNDDVLVASDYIFARGIRIYRHKNSYGNIVGYKPDRTVDYRIELEVINGAGSNVPWDLDSTTIGTVDTPIFQILEETGFTDSSAKAAATTFANVLSDGSTGWGSQEALISMGSNKWYADFTATVNTNYLKVAIRAASGVVVKWSITPKSTSINACWQPTGITLKLCKEVTTFGVPNSDVLIFRENIHITRFDEFRYFTGVTVLHGVHNSGRYYGFAGCTNLESIDIPESLLYLGDHAFANCTKLLTIDLKNVIQVCFYTFYGSGVRSFVFNEGFTTLGNANYSALGAASYVDLPQSTTTIYNSLFWSNSPNAVVVCRAINPPSCGTYNHGAKAYYVPAESLDVYKSTSGWSNIPSGKWHTIEGSWYETHREIDPNDE